MEGMRFYFFIIIGAVLGVLLCIAYCALVRASESVKPLEEISEQTELQCEHGENDASTGGEHE